MPFIYHFYIDNKEFEAPLEWPSIELEAKFQEMGAGITEVQPNIVLDRFTFINSAAEYIIDYLERGKIGLSNGALEGLKFQVTAEDGTNFINGFDGILNFKDSVQISRVKFECAIKFSNNVFSFFDRAQVSYYTFLATKPEVFPITAFKFLPVIVERVDAGPELASLFSTLVLLGVQAGQITLDLVDATANLIGHIAGGYFGPLGALLYSIIRFAALAIFLIVVLRQMAKLIKQIINILAPPIEFSLVLTLRQLLEEAVKHLGYTFQTSIDLLDKIIYLPSSTSKGLEIGIPRARDFGRSVLQMFEIAAKCFNGNTAIINGVVHFRPANDPFWIKNSTFILGDIGDISPINVDLAFEKVETNLSDFKATTQLSFERDGNDEWTTVEDDKTDFTLFAEPMTVSDPRNLLFDGLDLTTIPVALGVVKKEQSEIEIAINKLREQASVLMGIAGGGKLETISDRNGALKISHTAFNKPKLVYAVPIKEGLPILHLPKNQRDLFNPELLHDLFYSPESFSANGFKKQRRVFNNETIPFGFQNLIDILGNSYFTNQEGESAKFTSVKPNLSKSTAVVSGWVEDIITTNIKEIKISS